jgi:hypothetical protein
VYRVETVLAGTQAPLSVQVVNLTICYYRERASLAHSLANSLADSRTCQTCNRYTQTLKLSARKLTMFIKLQFV